MQSPTVSSLVNACRRAYRAAKNRAGLHWSYYDGVNLTGVTGDAEGAKFVVLARSCYSEEVWEFPPCDDQELKKMIKLRLDSDQDLRYEMIPRVDDSFQGARYATIWRPTVQLPPSTFMWVPVSWLLVSARPNITLVFEQGDAVSLIAQKHARGIASIAVDKDAMTVNQFRLGIGVELSSDVSIGTSIHQGLLEALAQLKMTQLVPFLPSFNATFSYERATHWATSFGLAWVLFMALSSSLLLVTSQWVSYQVGSFQSDTNEILTLRDRAERDNDLIVATLSALEATNHHADLWVVYRSLIDTARIETIRLDGEAIVLEGEATSSVNVMERLVTSEHVYTARFNRPVRRVGGYEEFSISFQLKERATLEN